MKLVYLAGPFTAKTIWEVSQNTMLFLGQLTEGFWYEGTLEILKRCDAIVMHPDWQLSKGSIEERRWAENNSIPVFYYDKDTSLKYTKFKEWADGESKKPEQTH